MARSVLRECSGAENSPGDCFPANRDGALGFATVADALVPTLVRLLFFNWPLVRIFLGDAGAYGALFKGSYLALVRFFRSNHWCNVARALPGSVLSPASG